MQGWLRLLAWLIVLGVFAAIVVHTVGHGSWIAQSHPSVVPIAILLLFGIGVGFCAFFLQGGLEGEFEARPVDNRHLQAFAAFLLVSYIFVLVPKTDLRWWSFLPRAAPLAALAWMRVRGSRKSDVVRDWGLGWGAGFWKECGVGALAATMVSCILVLAQKAFVGVATDVSWIRTLVWLDLPLGLLWAPVVEEALFRGALYRELRRSCRWWVAALANALLFAAWHGYDPINLVSYLIFGFTACALREWRDSVVAPMMMHFCMNAVVYIYLLTVL